MSWATSLASDVGVHGECMRDLVIVAILGAALADVCAFAHSAGVSWLRGQDDGEELDAPAPPVGGALVDPAARLALGEVGRPGRSSISRACMRVDGGRVSVAVGLGAADSARALGAGRVALVGGEPLSVLEWIEGDEGFGRLGSSLCADVDLDGDGLCEMLVGAPGDVQGRVDVGEFRLYSGDGLELLLRRAGVSDEVGLGAGVSLASDLDGDGHGDFLVSDSRGVTLVYSGASGEGLGALPRFSSVEAIAAGPAGWSFDVLGLRAVGESGYSLTVSDIQGGRASDVASLAGDSLSVRPVGDCDGDGVDDLAIIDSSRWVSVDVGGELVANPGSVEFRSASSAEVIGRYVHDVPSEMLAGVSALLGDLDADGVRECAVLAVPRVPEAGSRSRLLVLSPASERVLGSIVCPADAGEFVDLCAYDPGDGVVGVALVAYEAGRRVSEVLVYSDLSIFSPGLSSD